MSKYLKMRTRVLQFVLSGMVSAPFFSAQAVIFESTADPAHNTTAPTGTLANSGWQYEGQWGNYLGTPIASKFFITAGHVGGNVGDTFTYQGTSYKTVGYSDDPATDLRVWQVDKAFSSYAPLYTGNDETGKSLVVIGRGTQRGGEVTVDSKLAGWRYGTADRVQRWGQNVVDGAVDFGGSLGQMLVASFSANGLAEEAHLSSGDSGGAVFIEDGGVWKLAGINYGVEGPFASSISTSPVKKFDAALLDTRGLYEQYGGVWQQITGTEAIPSFFASTRISSRLDWIATAAVPEPSTYLAGLGALGMLVLFGRRNFK